ncbi:glycosyltransferase [Vibrio tapetis subsp. quintayensis]|uniref:glycosyltransferase n=1 Tax=Vibrio tapetis TaxID=52443 RepID=UPI0025B57AD1|nr:glycosyltransferase [Vibrio tapetis]MDN3679475.1 glycosyltransferase [Vibrio tapetis subsp. quintayensis]
MEETSNTEQAATIVAFSCRPNSGSEWGVGWNYLLMLSKLFASVNLYVRNAEEQQERIRLELDKLQIENVNLIAVDDLTILNKFSYFFKSSRSLAVVYYFWLLKVLYILIRNKGWNYSTHIFHITWVSDWIWTPFFLLPYKKKVLGPLGSQPPNFNNSSPDFYRSRIRYVIKFILRVNPLNWLNAFVSTKAIGISKKSIDRLPWSLVKDRIVISPVHSEMKNTTFSRDNAEVLLFIGKHLDFKNLDLFIHVARRCLLVRPTMKVVILGDSAGQVSEDLISLESDFPDRVLVKGKVDHSEVEKILCSHKTIMLQTSSEAGGTAPIESITCGSPVVCVNGFGISAFLESSYQLGIDFLDRDDFVLKAESLLREIWTDYEAFSDKAANLASKFTHEFTLAELKKFLDS